MNQIKLEKISFTQDEFFHFLNDCSIIGRLNKEEMKILNYLSSFANTYTVESLAKKVELDVEKVRFFIRLIDASLLKKENGKFRFHWEKYKPDFDLTPYLAHNEKMYSKLVNMSTSEYPDDVDWLIIQGCIGQKRCILKSLEIVKSFAENGVFTEDDIIKVIDLCDETIRKVPFTDNEKELVTNRLKEIYSMVSKDNEIIETSNEEGE